MTLIREISYQLSRLAQWWDREWFSLVPKTSINSFRIFHGITLLLYMTAWWQHAGEWLTVNGIHSPEEMVPPLLPEVLPLFGIVQFGSVALFIIGWRTQLMAAVTWACLFYVTMADRVSAYSINSIFLFTFAVFTTFPTQTKERTIEVAPIRLLQLALVMIYFSSGWNKGVFGDWLESPHVLESSIKGIYMTDIAAWALRTLPAFTWTILQYAVLAFELFSPVIFFSRKLRLSGIIVGCCFHLGIALFMDQLIYFSLQMMSFYLLFLPYRSPEIGILGQGNTGNSKITQSDFSKFLEAAESQTCKGYGTSGEVRVMRANAHRIRGLT